MEKIEILAKNDSFPKVRDQIMLSYFLMDEATRLQNGCRQDLWSTRYKERMFVNVAVKDVNRSQTVFYWLVETPTGTRVLYRIRILGAHLRTAACNDSHF